MNKIRIISASAGTGKTGELMQILYDEIQSGRVEPQGLMAVSFTTKAAGELARRVRQKLLEAGRPELAQAVAT
ncbi:MAG: UvrD-helicase domain-containing protein, partial [Bdellovibrionota bacterium]